MKLAYASAMDYLYDAWNTLKKFLSHKNKLVFCKAREVWWCSVGMNIDKEIFGKNELFERPVLIVKTYSRKLALVIPLTSQKLTKDQYAVPIIIKSKASYALLSQSRSISTKRLSRKMGTVSKTDFEVVIARYRESIS